MKDKLINPYRPGAGTKPLVLAGRDQELEEVSQIFEALLLNIPTQSIIYSGLRGVRKTVLLNALEEIAEEKGVFSKHIEVETRNDFISQISACAQSYLRKYSTKDKVQHLVDTALDAVKSLNVSFDPSNNTFALSVKERELYMSTNLTQSLTDVFTAIGELAYRTGRPVCFFIDEIQYMKQEELGAVIAAVHRSNQLGYPVMIIGAGLPKIYSMLSKEKSYSERLFIYKEIGGLDDAAAKKAIVGPAEKVGTAYAEDAVQKIIEITRGYPFFIQQFCRIIYAQVENTNIGVQDVTACLQKYYEELDDGFFKVRYERCSENDKRFIFAMVRCGELPCTIGNIAKNLHRRTTEISPTRAQLINKGIIYPVHYGELDFTVPEFDGFINRLDEYQKWKSEE